MEDMKVEQPEEEEEEEQETGLEVEVKVKVGSRYTKQLLKVPQLLPHL